LRRVVITGMGLVTPVGIGVDENWSALCSGRSGIGPITQFDASHYATRFAGEVKNFDPTRWIDKREAKTFDRFIQLGVAAAAMAVADAGFPAKLDDELGERTGCYVGAGLGGVHTIEKTYSLLLEKGPRHGFSPYFVPGIIVNLAPGQISIRHNLRGPNLSHVSACSTGARGGERKVRSPS